MSTSETWAELIAGANAPYAFELGLERGVRLGGQGHYPDLDIESADELRVVRLTHQVLRVRARHPGQDREEAFYVGRLVAVVEQDGEESEIEVGERTCLPTELVEQGVDLSRCSACGRKIVDSGSARVVEGQAVCRLCWVED